MKLTRLRLLGFKSFVEPTDFLIEPGLTGVVGPNGCGKSNLVEALRWVMGETSHKSMRAADMDDVIFSGSGNRPARNNAEVVDDDRQRRALGAGGRSTTPRCWKSRAASSARRARSTASTAATCAPATCRSCSPTPRPARARPRWCTRASIGEIIQAKPEQRRRVLEEAAGVAGLHARRHEAELRLKAAENNLTARRGRDRAAGRPDGRPEEAGAPGDPLPRTCRRKVRKAEATLFHLRWIAANAEVAEAEHAKDLSVREVAERTGAQAEAATRQAIAAAELPALREAEAARRGRRCTAHNRARDARPRGSSAPRSASPNSTGGWCSSPPTSSASSSWPPTPRRRCAARRRRGNHPHRSARSSRRAETRSGVDATRGRSRRRAVRRREDCSPN